MGVQVHVKAGSQLIALCDSHDKAEDVLASVRENVIGRELAVHLEAATTSTTIYFTFIENDLRFSDIIEGLMRKGVRLSYIDDPDGQCGFMTPIATGLVHQPLHKIKCYLKYCIYHGIVL